MITEKSCGAVVHTRVGGELRYVLVQSRGGYWGFPKGHVEPGETEEQTALREIREEVGLRVRLLRGFREETRYPLPGRADVTKQVVFFCAEYADQPLAPQESELARAALVPCEEALRRLSYEDLRRVLRGAHAFLTGPEEAEKP